MTNLYCLANGIERSVFMLQKLWIYFRSNKNTTFDNFVWGGEIRGAPNLSRRRTDAYVRAFVHSVKIKQM